MKGLLPSIDEELDRAAVGLVPQRPDITEFNLPSKLMNFMARGVPVLASVRPESETARLVESSGGGWLADAADPDDFPRAVRRIAASPEERAARGEKARVFAQEHFSADRIAEQFERSLERAVSS
jgi:colanic acid biosynthesis glycosyl transferase WcaI